MVIDLHSRLLSYRILWVIVLVHILYRCQATFVTVGYLADFEIPNVICLIAIVCRYHS